MASARVLLVELLTTDRLYQFRSELFPFVQGFLSARGAAVRWVALGHAAPRGGGEARFLVGLPAPELDALREAVAAFRPTHVLTNQELGGAVVEAVRGAAAGVRIGVAKLPGGVQTEWTGEVCDWLGWPPPEPADAALVDVAEPDHSCVLLGALARTIRPMVPVVGGPVCLYAEPLAQNPAFAGVDLERAHRAVGCSFCGERGVPRYRYRTAAEALALRQIRRAVETLPAERWSGEFLLTGSAAFLRLRALCEGLLAETLPPLALYFYCRIDELRRKAEAIDALLPRLAAAGHSIHLFAMGVENFSPAENQRFNKGLTDEDIALAFARLERWEREWPQAFGFRAHGGFSFILYTPWTTIADLRTNLAAARRYAFEESPHFFASRLQLFPRRPITLLAERDGLLAPEFADPAFAAYDSGCIVEPGQEELPWRFREPAVAAVYAASLRIAPPAALAGDDPLSRRVAALVAALPDAPGGRFRLFEALLDAAEEGTPDGAAPDPATLVERAAARISPADVGGAGGLAGTAAAPALPRVEGAGAGVPAAAPAAAPAAGAGPLTRALQAVLPLLEAHPKGLLRGFGAAGVAPVGAGTGELVAVELRRGAERLRLYVGPRGAADAPAYRRTERYALSFDPATPLDTDEKRGLADLLLRALERYGRGR